MDFLDQFGDNAWILIVFAITVFSWVAGKFKEWSLRNAGANEPTPSGPQPARVRPDQDDDDGEEKEEEPVPNLAVLLGLAPRRERRPPPTARPPTSAPPSARPAPEPPPTARPADRAAPPAPSVQPAPPPAAARPAPTPTPQPAPAELGPAPSAPPRRRFRRARFGRLDRSELRRAIILAEVLDKPLALRDESI